MDPKWKAQLEASRLSVPFTWRGGGGISSSRLTKILTQIRPDVIFVEESPSEWTGLAEFSKTKPMEFGAISKYIEEQPVKCFPVDLFTVPRPYLRNMQEVLGYVERVSQAYCQLIDMNEARMAKEGFSYLNSELYENIQLEIHSEVQRILSLRRSRPLDEAYASWIRQDHARELAMVEGIEEYYRENSFERAVFLVGAGHRASIVRIISDNETSGSTSLSWNYTNLFNAE